MKLHASLAGEALIFFNTILYFSLFFAVRQLFPVLLHFCVQRKELSNMEYDIFKETLKNKVSDLLEGSPDIQIRRYVKVNGISYDGLTVFCPDSNLSPTIPLTEFYEQYTAGRSMDAIAAEVVSFYNEYKVPMKVSVDHLSDYGKVKDKLRIRLLNRAMNIERLSDVPFREVLDLAACLYMEIEGLGIPNATCPVRNKELEAWGKTFEEVYADAEENMMRYEPGELKAIGEVIKGLRLELEEMAVKADKPRDFFLTDDVPEESPAHMFVLTTKGKTFGAAAMLDHTALRTLGELCKADIYVIPSSIHEVILLPDEPEVSVDVLRDMVTGINRTEVPRGDILSNHIYLYKMDRDEIVIAG